MGSVLTGLSLTNISHTAPNAILQTSGHHDESEAITKS